TPPPDPCAPCTASSDDADATAPASATGFARALLIGFDQPVKGDAVSVYADVLPVDGPRELVADILIDGQYRTVTVIADSSHGLTEPGAIVVALPAAPQQTQMFGTPACWL